MTRAAFGTKTPPPYIPNLAPASSKREAPQHSSRPFIHAPNARIAVHSAHHSIGWGRSRAARSGRRRLPVGHGPQREPGRTEGESRDDSARGSAEGRFAQRHAGASQPTGEPVGA